VRAVMRRKDLTAEDLNAMSALLHDLPSLISQDPLTGGTHWLPMAVAILRGFVHYFRACIYEKEHRPADTTRELEMATTVTRQAVEFWRQLPPHLQNDETYRVLAYKATSNLIYYLAMLVRGGSTKNNLDSVALEQQMQEHESIQINKKFLDSYKHWDNKMRGFVTLGKLEDAVKMAKQIYEELQSHATNRAGRALEFHEIGVHLDDDERVNFKSAVNVLFSEGREWT